MRASGIIVAALFIALVATPLVLRRDVDSPPDSARRLIIVTPHNEQIRSEFARGFAEWLRAQPGWEHQPVEVVWNVPGGTSEIRAMLASQFTRALRDGRSPGGAADLVFGGGQYEHDQLKHGVSIEVDGERRSTSISQPLPFDDAVLQRIFGENDIGGSRLYDPDGYWVGTALASFGILSNRDALERLGLEPPGFWRDLAQPSLRGWIALGNPASSGSMRKTFDTIIQHHGWERGWMILRRMAANARYFAASSSKVPIDVSQGDAATGACIDFYGRFQQQAIAEAGDPDRLVYVDPPGLTAIDADPISLLRGAPQRELAIMFIRFTLSDEGQLLWQLPRRDAGPGPRQHELRRMPIRRDIYDSAWFDQFVDPVNPFEQAAAFDQFNPESWAFVALLFSAMASDHHRALREAWSAIVTHPAFPREAGPDGFPIGAADVDDPQLRRMLELFDAMPEVPGPGGKTLHVGEVDDLSAIRAGWLAGGWAEEGLWPAQADTESYLRRQFGGFFAENYRRIVELAENGPAVTTPE